MDSVIVKPFLKWAGGKGQILNEIRKYYPFNDTNIFKYAEPFVGGGAVLFDILSNYNLSEIYIGDINAELINTYQVVRDDIDNLIFLLKQHENEFIPLDSVKRKEYYYDARKRFNSFIENEKKNISTEKAALMIFLNKTCFNGLYRVNKLGLFNVPIGKYKNPLICDEKNLREISKKLQKVIIRCADYTESESFIDENTFVYIDPPYRPLTSTSNFTSYNENLFDDNSQIELAKFVEKMHKKGAKILISNSDPQNIDSNDNFFENLYQNSNIKRIEANRMINCNGDSRGKINELLISNF